MTLSTRHRQARRSFLFAGLATLALVGCSTGPRPIGPVGPIPGDARNHVAVLVPLTGPDAGVGTAIANAAKLALADTGNQSLDLTVYDTAEGGAAGAANRAIAGGAQLILGPLLSEQVRAVAPLARSARVPVLAFSNDEAAAGNGVYILGFVPGQAIERVVAQARSGGATRFAAIAPQTPYGERAAEGVRVAVQRAGGRLVGIERYATAAQAQAGLRRLGAAGYDALVLADGGRQAALLAPAVAGGAKILGPDLWAAEHNLGRVPRLRGALYAAPADTRFAQFASRYRARYGAAPVRLASLGYDAVLLTVRAAKGWTPGRRFPLGALSDDEGFVGVDGVFRFTRAGMAERGLEVRQVTATGSSLVSPAPTRF